MMPSAAAKWKAFRWALMAMAIVGLCLAARTAVRQARAQRLTEEGWRALKADRSAQAIGAFKRAEALCPGTPTAARGLGESYLRLWRRAPASATIRRMSEDAFARAVAASPADLEALLRLRQVRGVRRPAIPAETARNFDEAARLAARHPDVAALQSLLLEFAAEVAGIQGAMGLVADNAVDRKAVIEAAGLLLRRKEVTFDRLAPLAEMWLFRAEDLLAVTGNAKGNLDALMKYLLKSGRWDREGGLYLKAAETGGTTLFAPVAAIALASLGRGEEGLLLLREELRRREDDAEVHFALARLFDWGQGTDPAAADKHYRRAQELRPQEPRYRKLRGISHYVRREYDRALRELAVAQDLRPDDPETVYYLGLVYERVGRADLARESFRRAWSISPKNEEYRRAMERTGGTP